MLEVISLQNSFELFGELRFMLDSKAVIMVIKPVTIRLGQDIATESVEPVEGSPEFELLPRFPKELLIKSGWGRFAQVGIQ